VTVAKRYRLDRFLSIATNTPRRSIRQILAQKRVTVDGEIADDIRQQVDQFSLVTLDGIALQHRSRRYILLHKPVGVVSATKDDIHRTVIDVLRDSGLPDSELNDLHIAGRLDLNSSGLLLLTNDSDWSAALMAPDKKVAKVYEVTLGNPISDECITAFEQGIYFPYENITTKPAVLERLTPNTARVTLVEGKYHQIKRMFGRFRNPVLKLHRVAIGDIRLDASLESGQFLSLSAKEITPNL
jgi:16S rRNA pseudouridine516 synthase